MFPVYLSFSGFDLGVPGLTAGVASVYLVAIGLLMASRLPTWSGKGAGIRVPRDYAIPIILGLVAYVAVLLSFFWQTLTLTAIAYFVSIVFSARAFSRRAAIETHDEDQAGSR